MNAGAGADEQSRRMVQRAAELRAKADALEATSQQWQAGADGERRVGSALETLGVGWRVLHDVHWPGRPKANLDHVAIGPSGVWVIDAKNWSGRVVLADGVLRQNGYKRETETEAAATAAAAVAALLEPRHRLLAHGVICLAGEGAEISAGPTPCGTVVVGLSQLSSLLTDGRACLSPAEVIAVHGWLRGRLGASASPGQLTTAALPVAGAPVLHEAPARWRGRRPSTNTRPAASPGVGRRSTSRPPVRARRPRKSNGVGAALLRVLVILFGLGLFATTMPVWFPMLVEIFGSTLLPAMMPDLPTPTPTLTPTAPTPSG